MAMQFESPLASRRRPSSLPDLILTDSVKFRGTRSHHGEVAKWLKSDRAGCATPPHRKMYTIQIEELDPGVSSFGSGGNSIEKNRKRACKPNLRMVEARIWNQ
jgi:hypothetical protein